jgi:hypothetical protein
MTFIIKLDKLFIWAQSELNIHSLWTNGLRSILLAEVKTFPSDAKIMLRLY